MKNYIVICAMACLLMLGNNLFAQEKTNVAKGAPAGFVVQTPRGIGYLFTVGFEHCFGSVVSIQGDIGYDGNLKGGIIKPSLRFYLTGTAPQGINLGPYVATSFRSGGAIIAFGGSAGYQHLLLENKNLAVFGNIGAGFGFNTNANAAAGFNMLFEAGAGYAF